MVETEVIETDGEVVADEAPSSPRLRKAPVVPEFSALAEWTAGAKSARRTG
jgi:hypothetical protein